MSTRSLLSLTVLLSTLQAGCNDTDASGSSQPPEPSLPVADAETPQPSAAKAPEVAWTKIPQKSDDATLVRAAARDATGVPVVYIGAVWCGPCKQYKASLSDPRMMEAHTGAHIIELDADRHSKALGELGIRPMGVPHWEMVDKTGTPVDRTIDGSHWKANTPEEMAPALGKFFGLGHG